MKRNEHLNSDYQNRQQNTGNLQNHLSNYQDSYRTGGNYYGMDDTNALHRNVRQTNGNNRYTNNSDNYTSGSFRNQGSGNNNQNDYHYGDPNNYMQGQRNTQSGRSGNSGYEFDENRGQGSAGQHYSGNYQAGNRSNSQSGNPYSRQNNSYQQSGEGRRYSEFGRDEQHSYNPGSIDMYQDRSDFNYSRSDNDYGSGRGRGSSNYYDGNFDNEDFRYGNSEIRETDRSRNRNQNRNNHYGSGRYASNRAYLSDNDEQRPRRSSGPDYSADSPISGYGQSDLRG